VAYLLGYWPQELDHRFVSIWSVYACVIPMSPQLNALVHNVGSFLDGGANHPYVQPYVAFYIFQFTYLTSLQLAAIPLLDPARVAVEKVN